jgi:hypothetical protein
MLMIVGACDDTPSLQDRSCTIGIVGPDLVARWALAATSAARPTQLRCRPGRSAHPRLPPRPIELLQGSIALLDQATQKALARD